MRLGGGRPAGLPTDLAAAPLVALDDVQAALPDRQLEEALMGLVEMVRQRGGRLLWSATRPPLGTPAALPDLVSRWSSAAVFRLHRVADEELQKLLEVGLRAAGLSVSPPVLQWLLRRVSRDPGDLQVLMDQLADAAIDRQRALTVPMVRELFATAAGGPGG